MSEIPGWSRSTTHISPQKGRMCQTFVMIYFITEFYLIFEIPHILPLKIDQFRKKSKMLLNFRKRHTFQKIINLIFKNRCTFYYIAQILVCICSRSLKIMDICPWLGV